MPGTAATSAEAKSERGPAVRLPEDGGSRTRLRALDAKNVVLLLSELEDSGHLVRRRDPEDRRRHRVHITPAGGEALARAARAQESIENEVLQALDAEERAILWRLLARALHGAEHADAEADRPALAPAAH